MSTKTTGSPPITSPPRAPPRPLRGDDVTTAWAHAVRDELETRTREQGHMPLPRLGILNH